MSRSRGVNRWAVLAFTAYLALVFVVVFLLKVGDMPLADRVGGVLRNFQDRDLLIGIRYGHVEAAANVLFFVPLGALLTLIFAPPRWIVGWLLCLGLSAFIECVQFFFLPGRVGSVRDVICNGFGAGMGALLAFALAQIRVWARRKHLRRGTNLRID
ncbi:VanZ family protein [Paeniglutamicibacter sp. NPDC091659]|uniref:VanZ family protein n=1 Tax=Paeniglutamicibacter sp. NPDC091659 TaxID=3364389 RepID=UPI003823D304